MPEPTQPDAGDLLRPAAEPTPATTDRGERDGFVLDILEAAPDPMLAVDAAGQIVLVNRLFERMFGYGRGELIGRSVDSLVPEPLHAIHALHRQRYFEHPEPRMMGAGTVLFAKHRDGSQFPVEISLSPIGTGPRLVVSAVRDATDRWQGEQVLRDELGELRLFAENLLDAAPGIVLVLDTEGRVVRFNPFLERISGRTFKEVRGLDWFVEFLPARDHDRLRATFDQTLAGGETTGTLNAVIDANGIEHMIRWTNRRLEDAQQRVRGVLSIGLDVTESYRAEQENRTLRASLQQQGRMAELGTVAAKLAHDVGNAVAGLSIQTQLIERYAPREDKRSALVEAAHDARGAVKRLEEMVAELKEFSREQRLELGLVQLPLLLRALQRLWLPIAEEHGIELMLQIAEPMPELRVDRTKLQRVIDNLIANAMEAIGEGPGRVTLHAECAGPRACIEVIDSGPGVPAGIEPFRLFETTKAQGTGLGLAVCREIVQAHGGGIDFANRETGGAAFRIELPVDGPRGAENENPPVGRRSDVPSRSGDSPS